MSDFLTNMLGGVAAEPNSDQTDPHVCARCAAAGPTCCQISSGQEELCFPLSNVEMDRIRDFAPPRGWFVQEPNAQRFVANVARLFPTETELVKTLFPAAKFHFRLATRTDGRCVFLGEQGCGLPREARPYYCRLYPVWRKGESLCMIDAPCLALRESRGTAHMLRTLGLSPQKVADLHSRLRMAWGLPPKEGLDLPEGPLAGRRRK
jgi:Fe-S-cluster containining protein